MHVMSLILFPMTRGTVPGLLLCSFLAVSQGYGFSLFLYFSFSAFLDGRDEGGCSDGEFCSFDFVIQTIVQVRSYRCVSVMGDVVKVAMESC